ncbi:MAG: urate hydroxylase PuuD [Candidatus Acidiferrales bacterium]
MLPLLTFAVDIEFPAGVMTHVEQVLRVIHILAGVLWIGFLYFFNLVSTPVLQQSEPGLRAQIIPRMMPRAMWWFRWSALVTFLAGFLYFLIYLMTDAKNSGEPALLWRWLGLWFLVWVLVWGALYALVRAVPQKSALIAIAGTLIVAAGSYAALAALAHPAISSRSLATGVGGGMGLVLLLNVWGVVWRVQKRLIAWTRAAAEQGTPLPPEAASLQRTALLVSRISAWLTIPLLFFMAAATHYSFLSGQ